MLVTKRPAVRAFLLGLVSLFLTAPAAVAQEAPSSPSDPQPTTGPYETFWVGGTLPPTNGDPWRDFAAETTFGDLPVRRDMFVLYEGDSGLYPYAGVQQVESDPDWMRRHFLRLQAWVDRLIPDVNQTGYGVIDYEAWEPCWSLLVNFPSNQGPTARDMDFKDDWRDYIRQYRPELLQGRPGNMHEGIFERSYNEAAQRFLTATINECKRLRPNLKWGYYLYPPRTYYGMMSANARAEWAAKHRTTLAWLYEVQDAFFPDVYALYYTVHDRQPNYQIQEDPAWMFNEYVRWNITQAKELANGKPVIAFVFIRYHENARHYTGQFLNDYNLEKSFTIPKQYGADGVALWDSIGSLERANATQNYINTKVLPVIRANCTDAAGNSLMPPAQSNAGSPSSGGSSGDNSNNSGQQSGGGSSNQNQSNAGNADDPNDPLRTRPYVNVRPEDNSDPEPSGGSSSAGSGGSGDTVTVPHVNPRRGTINVPRNVRNGRSNNRNPSWPAVVQRGVNTTN